MKQKRKTFFARFLLISLFLVTGCEDISNSEKPTPIYNLTVDDIHVNRGESVLVKSSFQPVDYIPALDFTIIESNPLNSIRIEGSRIYGDAVGSATVLASATNFEGAEVSFQTMTTFEVVVSLALPPLSSQKEITGLWLDDVSLNLNDIEDGVEIDYQTFLKLVDNKDDIRPFVKATLSNYAFITSASFTLNAANDGGLITIEVTAQDGSTKEYTIEVKGYYISKWINLPLINGDFETGTTLEGWDLENFVDRNVTSSASSIDLTPVKSPSTRVFSMYGKVKDEKKTASLTQNVPYENWTVGDKIVVSCVISTSYGTRIKSIKLVAGNQAIEMDNMVRNWRAQIISQEFILQSADIVNGNVQIGLAFISQDESSTSDGWMYLDDFSLMYLNKIYPVLEEN